MPSPPEMPSLVAVALEQLAERLGLPPSDLADYAYRRKVPAPDVRAAIVEALFPRVHPDDFLRLPQPESSATLATMQARTESDEQRARRARSKIRPKNRSHPFLDAVVEKKTTVAKVAQEIGWPRSTVQSWYDARKANARPIPREAAEALKKLLGVPLSTWPRIVD